MKDGDKQYLGPGKEMTAATVKPKLDTGTRAADAIAVGETRSETKKLDSRKSKLLAAGYEDKDDK